MTKGATEPVVLTLRESQIVEKLIEGKSHKIIARELGLALGTINRVVSEVARKVPGSGAPSYRVRKWFWHDNAGSTEGISPPPAALPPTE